MDPRGLPPLAGEDHACQTCALVYADVSIEGAIEAIMELSASVRAAVSVIPVEAHRRRRRRSEWSVAEYVCHLRDVFVSSTIRLHRIRTKERPALEPILNDLRANRFRYNECNLPAVIDELASGIAGFLDETAVTYGQDWDRTATRLPGETRTARWVVRQAMHEGVHHLADIRRIGSNQPDAQADRSARRPK